ncbi:hypothetical protein J6590_084470 [Homalodisca vitripennis]|nr:hypothetical protein J6590_084470 [Homalodisca vitripennis]
MDNFTRAGALRGPGPAPQCGGGWYYITGPRPNILSGPPKAEYVSARKCRDNSEWSSTK